MNYGLRVKCFVSKGVMAQSRGELLVTKLELGNEKLSPPVTGALRKGCARI